MAAFPKRVKDLLAKMMADEARISLAALPQRTDLKTSSLFKSVEVTESVNSFDLLLNYYWKFVDGGRRAGARMPPFDAILKWVKRYKIWDGKGSLNRLVNSIRFAIKANGIKARPFVKNLRIRVEASATEILQNALGSILLEIIVV